MTEQNPATVWGKTLVTGLLDAGLEAVCLAPGSRCTPLTLAFTDQSEISVFSELDERSAGYFAVGRAKQTGLPTAVVCTSGTAAANLHPAVVEAHQARVPLLVLTADRPPELRDSGANQTIEQRSLYGDAVRWSRELPETAHDERALRSLAVSAGRAIAETTGTPAGPVHLNIPFRKPLQPEHPPAQNADSADPKRDDLGTLAVTQGRPTLEEAQLEAVAATVSAASRGLLVCGPAEPGAVDPDAIAALSDATGFPILADPLSGLRFGAHVEDCTVLGGYDSYLPSSDCPDPDLVLRFGASPTSKSLRTHLEHTDARQLLVDPAGEWREERYRASELLRTDASWLACALAERRSEAERARPYADQLADLEASYRELLETALESSQPFEGSVVAEALASAPADATIFVSNSSPVRDLDRYALPRKTPLTVLGNRGASGIDGITSTALGAGSASEDPLVLVTGDLAFYHDMNGLLAVERCELDATIVLLNNDGGGIFHRLPIAEFDSTFRTWFETPHGLEFSPVGELYGLEYCRVESMAAFAEAYRASLDSSGTQLLEVPTDSEAAQRTREEIQRQVSQTRLE